MKAADRIERLLREIELLRQQAGRRIRAKGKPDQVATQIEIANSVAGQAKAKVQALGDFANMLTPPAFCDGRKRSKT